MPKTLLEKIKTDVESYGEKNLVIAGDLNTYLNLSLDKKGERIE